MSDGKVVGLRGERVGPLDTNVVFERTPPLKDMIIVGLTPNGHFYSDSTHMNNRDALWLMEIAKQQIMMDNYQCPHCGGPEEEGGA